MPPLVIVVDEFTYLYEILRRTEESSSANHDLRDFMRQWKGMLEARLFSALIVGQDTMPSFLHAFPNEFSVMQTKRLDYLSADETQRLAELPILHEDGTTRFNGYALGSLAAMTDGHPFFTQILCDRLVERANAAGRSDFSQTDVEEALESLVAGADAIEPHKFDCFLTADNAGTLVSDPDEPDALLDPRTAQKVLERLAVLGGSQNSPVGIDDLELSGNELAVMEDLVRRAVVRRYDGGRLQIRVLLYADYLRRNGT